MRFFSWIWSCTGRDLHLPFSMPLLFALLPFMSLAMWCKWEELAWELGIVRAATRPPLALKALTSIATHTLSWGVCNGKSSTHMGKVRRANFDIGIGFAFWLGGFSLVYGVGCRTRTRCSSWAWFLGVGKLGHMLGSAEKHGFAHVMTHMFFNYCGRLRLQCVQVFCVFNKCQFNWYFWFFFFS